MYRLVFLLFFCGIARGQDSAPAPHLHCPEGLEPYVSREPAKNLRITAKSTALFVPNYKGVPDSVKTVVEKAIAVWDKILISRIPIHMDVIWEPLETFTLASAGADRVYKNFRNAPFREIWYPSALAEAIQGENITGSGPDIVLRINSEAKWNTAKPPSFSTFDMRTVVLHEIAHGLGFMSSFSDDNATYVRWGINNIPMIFDKFMRDEAGNEITNPRFYTNDSKKLLEAVSEKEVNFRLDSGYYAATGLRLHTENPFSSGASLSHFSPGQGLLEDDRLMLPSIRAGFSSSMPGPGTLAVLYQLGWSLNMYEFDREYTADSPRFRLYPNPVTDRVTLSTEEEKLNYQLFDGYGKILKAGTLNAGESELSLQQVPAGRFYLRIGETTLPLIKL